MGEISIIPRSSDPVDQTKSMCLLRFRFFFLEGQMTAKMQLQDGKVK